MSSRTLHPNDHRRQRKIERDSMKINNKETCTLSSSWRRWVTLLSSRDTSSPKKTKKVQSNFHLRNKLSCFFEQLRKAVAVRPNPGCVASPLLWQSSYIEWRTRSLNPWAPFITKRKETNVPGTKISFCLLQMTAHRRCRGGRGGSTTAPCLMFYRSLVHCALSPSLDTRKRNKEELEGKENEN